MVFSLKMDEAKFLFKKLQNDMQKGLDKDKCNDYIEGLNKIKEELEDSEEYWVGNLEEIYVLEDGIFSEISDKDVQIAVGKVKKQLEKILFKLGVDTDEINIPKKDSPSTVIQVSPTFSQNQATNVSMNMDINIQQLVKEFEEEINKPIPDKSKLKSIIQKILESGGHFAPKILELILKSSLF